MDAVKLAVPLSRGPRRYVSKTALPYKVYSFRGRKVDLGKPVEVYRNLNRGEGVWYSIRQGGRIVAHAQGVMLQDATFHVSEAGRQRVLATGRKNVHAWVRGVLIPSGMGTSLDRGALHCRVNYNPFKGPSFVWKDASCDRPVKGAMTVMLDANGMTGCYFT